MSLRKTLLILLSVTPAAATIGLAQTSVDSKLPSISGVVRDSADNPLSDAQLSLSRAGEPARLFRTGVDGTYSFSSVAPGDVLVSVRRLGYKGSSRTISVTTGSGSNSIDFLLLALPNDIDEVVVESSKQHLAEFYQRKATNTFAKFFEHTDIEKRNPLYLSEMLGTVSGAVITPKGAGNQILLRGCQPMVWVDGMRAPGAELDDVARPGDIAGMEVYPSNAGIPPTYQDRNNRMCGAILVWTKNQ